MREDHQVDKAAKSRFQSSLALSMACRNEVVKSAQEARRFEDTRRVQDARRVAPRAQRDIEVPC